jgi:small subunit ribosomal protein S6
VKEYELVVLYHPDLEVDMTKPLDNVAGIIKDAGGKIVDEDDWGRKKLAYKIAGENFAIYRVYTLELPAAAVKKINDTLNITSEVLRFLLIKVDQKIKQMIEEEQKLEEEKEEEEVKTEEEG